MNENKNSALGIVALVLSILGCTFVIGAILAIIDLCKNAGRKKVLPIISLVICGIWLLVGILGGKGLSEKNKKILLEKYGSVKAISKLSEYDLEQIITKRGAKAVYEFFKQVKV